MKKHGFSLAEALITLLIISITTAALAPTITTRRNAALNPNLYWSATGGGVIASGSLNNVLFGIGANPGNNAALTVGNGGVAARNALQISGVTSSTGNVTTTAQLKGNTIVSDTTVTATGNITSSAQVKGATVVSDGTVTATGNISGNNMTATGDISGKNITASGTINQLSGGEFLTTTTCPSSKWTKSSSAIQVCKDASCVSKLELYTCTYNGS